MCDNKWPITITGPAPIVEEEEDDTTEYDMRPPEAQSPWSQPSLPEIEVSR